jgi:hypothetical protein
VAVVLGEKNTLMIADDFLFCGDFHVTDHLPPGVPQGGQKHQWTQHCHRPQVDCGQLVQGVCQVVPVSDGESKIVRVERTHGILSFYRSSK